MSSTKRCFILITVIAKSYILPLPVSILWTSVLLIPRQKKQLKYTANIKISTDLLKLFQNNGYISSNISFVCGMWWVNQLYAIGLFLCHLKTENVSFSDVSKRYRKRLEVRNGLEDSITEYNQTKLASQLLPSMPLGYLPVNDKGAYLVKQF